MPESAHRAVFLSYASQDAEAARRICATLRADGIEVWFDADGGLEHGDAWDAKIRRQIKECLLFIPVISASTQARLEGYFRIEWELAAQRALGIAAGVPFILPVVIDDTRDADALVPDRFRAVQWTRLPGGIVPSAVQARLLKLWSHRVGAINATSAAYLPPSLAPTASGPTSPIGITAFGGRRLAAIVFTDVVGYSARMQRDEAATMELVQADFAFMREACERLGGEVLNTMGDGLLLSFPSAVQAVECALQVQAEFGGRKTRVPPEQALEHRMGIHIGDVFRQETGGVAGDGVNIAARLEGKAPVGGICVSQMVHDTVKGKVQMQAVFIGPESFKNITEPIPVWHIAPAGTPTLSHPPLPAKIKVAPPRSRRLAPALVAGVALAGVTGWWFWRVPRPARAPVTAAPVIDGKSVAVLAFKNMSEDQANEYFSDGISEELLNVFAKIPGLKVSARTSAFHFKGKDTPIPEIARQLGVAYVLEGSVRKSGDTVRITAQLIKAADGFPVWSENFDRDLRDVFAVQSEIAQTVVERLRGQLGAATIDLAAKAAIKAQVQAAIKGGTKNAEAHEQYLQGQYLERQQMLENLDRPVAYYRRAVELDPSFALGWAALSRTYGWKASLDRTLAEIAESFALARRAADRALEREPGLGAGHSARMLIQINHDFDWRGARESLRKARAAGPLDSALLPQTFDLDIIFGQADPARNIALVREAVALDPVNPKLRIMLIGAYGEAHRFQEAETEASRLIELHPTFDGFGLLSGNFLFQGRFGEALAQTAKISVEWVRLFTLAVAHAGLKNTAASDAALNGLITAYPEQCAYQIALVYGSRHESDKAFEWLDRAYAQRDSGLPSIKANEFLQDLHSDPRWPAFLRKLGMADDQLK